jgi:hypothetical protein
MVWTASWGCSPACYRQGTSSPFVVRGLRRWLSGRSLTPTLALPGALSQRNGEIMTT